MLILGIDPGTAIIGYGLIEAERGQNCRAKAFGCIKTAAGLATARRLNDLHSALTKIIKKYRPDAMAVEDIFFFKNLKTAVKVSQARGVILLAGQQCHLPIYEFTPLQVKQALTGYGRAEKKQIQQMVKAVLGLDDLPRPDDAADALAIAVCCFHSLGRPSLKR
ncbi:MAG: crossover junction endodeoxyribonuclease RuvC [Candidatus Portnoybacteria bacterium]|nr:crossover junction endodeoxyribonuclease RuvC [Candidatus Portnoybacteria bacterium]